MEKLYQGTQVQRKRVKRFVNYLRTKVKPRYFDLGTVCSVDKGKKLELNVCGTVACAMGNLPGFNPQRFEFKFDWECQDSFLMDIRDKVTGQRSWFDIAESYFGFINTQISAIFSIGGYQQGKVTPKMVAKKIEKLLNNNLKWND